MVSETFVLNEVLELRRRGHDVTVFALYPPERLPEHPGAREEADRAIYLDARLRKVSAWKWAIGRRFQRDARALFARGRHLGQRYAWLARYAIVFGRLLREKQFDVLHAHFASPGAEWAYMATRVAHIPFTFTAHGSDIFRRPPEAFSAISKAALATITVSNFNKEFIRSVLAVDAERIHVIPCGIDVGLFRPDDDSRRRRDAVPQLITVARLAPEKDYGTLLAAYAELRRRGWQFKAWIVGSGPEHERLLAVRSELGLDDIVDFCGSRGAVEVRDLLRMSDAFCLSSTSETLGVVYLEAMACGLPVVGTDVLGVSEAVCAGETGSLVGPSQPRAFADAIEKLLQDPDHAREMGKAGRHWVEMRFSLTRQVNDLLSVWTEVGSELGAQEFDGRSEGSRA